MRCWRIFGYDAGVLCLKDAHAAYIDRLALRTVDAVGRIVRDHLGASTLAVKRGGKR